MFAATPAFWSGLHSQFQQELRRERRRLLHEEAGDSTAQGAAAQGGAAQGDAMEVGVEEERTTAARLAHDWHERKVLGNRVQVLLSTGAPLSHEVSRWLFRVVGRKVLNGFGTTETGQYQP